MLRSLYCVVTFNTDNIQIQLEKSTAMHWEVLGSYLPGHGTLTTRVKRGQLGSIKNPTCALTHIRYYPLDF